MQQDFVGEQLSRYCAARRACPRCTAVRKLQDSHCSEVRTVIGRVSYIRERSQACSCGADDGRYISPLKNYRSEAYTAELKWMHAKLGAMLPYRQTLEILSLLLPSSGQGWPRHAAAARSTTSRSPVAPVSVRRRGRPSASRASGRDRTIHDRPRRDTSRRFGTSSSLSWGPARAATSRHSVRWELS
jgi:hypothetical protein